MKAANLLFILSDEHSRNIAGCYGDPVVKTPNIDRLAKTGTRFTNAYASSPICVPTRSSIATGRYVHQTSCWDSAQGYHGQLPSWGHHLIADGHEVNSVGKLHYRDSQDDNGFKREILPIHMLNGVGWVKGLLRNPLPSYEEGAGYANEIGPGDSVYTDYDRRVCQAACDWLSNEAAKHPDKPWVLFVGFVAPHYPLIAPTEFYNLYSDDQIPMPKLYDTDPDSLHPAVAAVRKFFNYDDYFDENKVKIARQAYYGLCSFVDHHIGQLLDTLEKNDLSQNTRVIYTSDHGDCLGERGIWAKSVMYESSVAIPLIMAGPGIPQKKIISTPVTHIDFYPTIIEGADNTLHPEEEKLPGQSLFKLLDTEDPDRVAFSEYHDGGSITGSFMIRTGRWKYVYHVGYQPQLFDLVNDPMEIEDLSFNPEFTSVRNRCESILRSICDPERENNQAFEDQRLMIKKLGGEENITQYELFDFTPVPKEIKSVGNK